jgi:hypothetical protein
MTVEGFAGTFRMDGAPLEDKRGYSIEDSAPNERNP